MTRVIRNADIYLYPNITFIHADYDDQDFDSLKSLGRGIANRLYPYYLVYYKDKNRTVLLE